MEALRLEARKAKATAEKDAQRFTREMAKATESVKTTCHTLCLALTEMGEKVRVIPGEGASAFDFSEWTQQAGGAVSDSATAYANCCACVSVAFTMGLLQQNECEHIAEFPKLTKGDWEVSSQDVSPALRAWRKQFWQKEGRSTVKARLLEHLAKVEAAEQGKEPATEEGGADTGAGADVDQYHLEV
uniref:OSJNBa0072D08.19 protein n=1 Tax=Oryza sativa subsp. japonica TaxID=39947 RepID=Q7XLB0_ORYSJ|nr:OSJNBa0072D08.19 [Oryza sativa Japonica Group]CAE05239.2 OSJNBb0115I09.1 [Oryza sativa Japonica Group]